MKRWKVIESKIKADKLQSLPDKNPVVLRLLEQRGFSAAEAEKFLAPDYAAQLHDPFLFRDMTAAVALIFKHLQAGNKITVYGDYDADGVTATAVMFKVLNFLMMRQRFPKPQKGFGNLIDVYIPHRESEGYGLNIKSVEQIAAGGSKLIITVDGGIRSVNEVVRAKELGLDVIITDHHEPGEEVPDCLIINPKIQGETYPFSGLAGVGVAFKVAQALLTSPPPSLKLRWTSPTPPLGKGREHEVFLKWLLDLVAIGTIADLMPLVDENRVLAAYGLVVLNKTSRIGLRKLIAVAQSGVDKNGNTREIDAWQIGFQLAPRLNAAGRLDHANSAYRLLATEDEKEAATIAEQLNKTNIERQNITQKIFEYADTQVHPDDKILFAVWPHLSLARIATRSVASGPNPCLPDRQVSPCQGEGNHATVGASPSPYQGEGGGEVWPAGIMGLVAGKLTEKYYRPALAITQKENGNGKKEIVGSARSIPEFNVTAMLEECAEFLTNFGGHKQAAGFSLTPQPPLPEGEGEINLEKFLVKAREIANRALKDTELVPTLEIDIEINFADISDELHEALNKLRPFGAGNAQPKFLSKNLQVVNVTNMGAEGQHLKLRLLQSGKFFDAVAFSISDEWKKIKMGDKIDLVYYVDMNEWNGLKNIQLKIIDIKIHE